MRRRANKQVRILHLNAGNLYGGVETVLAAMARSSCPELEQHFMLCFRGRLYSELSEAGVPVYDAGRVRTRWPWTVVQARRRCKAVLAGGDFQAVICHMPWSLAIFGPEARAAACRLIFWLHNPVSGRHWIETWARRTPPDLVIANSRFTAASAGLLYPRTRCEIVHYPVPDGSHVLAAPRETLRRQLGAGPESVVIIQVSRLERWKGHRLHLEALASLRDMPDWVCWFVGGPQRPEEHAYLAELERAAQELEIGGRVRWLGQRADVPALLAASDIFCQPNTDPEPFGICFVEAMWSGLPVVASAMAGPLEIVDEQCGFLAEPGNAADVARFLGVLIRSPELRKELGANGRRRAAALCEPTRQIRRLAELLGSPARHAFSGTV